MPTSVHSYPHWLIQRHIHADDGHELKQIESSVEPVSKRSQIDLALLSVSQLVACPGQRGLDVAHNGSGPLELGQIFRFEISHHPRYVIAPGIGFGGKVPQAVTLDDATGLQASASTLGMLRKTLW